MALPTAPFVSDKSVFTTLAIFKLALDAALTGVTSATDTITKTAHGLAVGDAVDYVSGTGFTGLDAGSTYYVVTAADADTFKLSETRGGSAISVGTSSAGVFQPVQIFASKKSKNKAGDEMKYLERPDVNGTVRRLRSARTKAQDSFNCYVDEVKRLPDVFAGAMAGRRTGTCTIYIPDIDDADGFVSQKSEDFTCTVTREGDIDYGEDFTSATLLVESNEDHDLQWENDAAV